MNTAHLMHSVDDPFLDFLDAIRPEDRRELATQISRAWDAYATSVDDDIADGMESSLELAGERVRIWITCDFRMHVGFAEAVEA